MNAEDIIDWYHRPRKSSVTADRAQELYFQFHPRTSFLKMLPANAVVADIGAGDGSLSTFRIWPEPERADLRLYAYSIEKGLHFDEFEGYEISDWNVTEPSFGGVDFDAIVSAHFIEHIHDPISFVRWANRNLKPGGAAYLEWPSPASLSLPPRRELAARGVDLIISRFDDDDTHQALPDCGVIEAEIASLKMCVVGKGIVRLPWIEEELMAHFRASTERFCSQAAFWSWSGWAQYLIFQKHPM